MPTFKLTILAEVDGRSLPGFPLIRRLAVDEAQAFAYEQTAHGDAVTFTAAPTAEIATVQVLHLRTDKAITIRLANQSDAGIGLEPGGLLFLLDGTLAAATNVAVNNNSGETAFIEGVAGGS